MAIHTLEKSRARNAAKLIRARLVPDQPAAGVDLVKHWPRTGQRSGIVALYLPIHSEIDCRPLARALDQAGHRLALPCIVRKAHPLQFRRYQLGDQLRAGPYGTKEPQRSAEIVEPDIILLPLLAYSRAGYRLGYGGGYYDRTLADLRAKKQIFACGLAYAGQEVPVLPTDAYDQKLDGVLTEAGFQGF